MNIMDIAVQQVDLLVLFVVKLEQFFFESSKFGDIVWYQALTPIVGIGLSSLLIERVYKKHFFKGQR